MKKIVLIIAHEGFQHLEYRVPKRIIEDAGMQVLTASDAPGNARGKDGSNQLVDLLLTEVNPTDYDGVFVIGGPGALKHLDNQETNRIVNEAMILGKPYGSICISSRILAKAHVLTEKKATGWDGDNELAGIFSQNNVAYVREPVVIDGNAVTAVGPEAAEEFGHAIVNVLGV
ncbi:MAG: hypothetical protein COU35_00365 [Candidatus Magasanikbacteria bacterium CG10_big_fil_rev_8_21_14_0_10_47_10]|uniref:DJ-1/PfpI domain-containing protein n=1 Tax=Candidatus Magasanikbacteria bacterium CG10_big_fil_rev_8_21_14_0_10_47_10 TaxID=1974652 RepID=A0A2H0TTU4_9BACT|nr:MAG: hypothetical protein COU35_00365 [Candidatus Magasanikbacteria bacterium CG10_big_fil_rev_8_21_14_0_10_47_10]